MRLRLSVLYHCNFTFYIGSATQNNLNGWKEHLKISQKAKFENLVFKIKDIASHSQSENVIDVCLETGVVCNVRKNSRI